VKRHSSHSQALPPKRPAMGYIEEMRAVIDEFPDSVLLGEVQGGIDRIGQFYDKHAIASSAAQFSSRRVPEPRVSGRL